MVIHSSFLLLCFAPTWSKQERLIFIGFIVLKKRSPAVITGQIGIQGVFHGKIPIVNIIKSQGGGKSGKRGKENLPLDSTGSL